MPPDDPKERIRRDAAIRERAWHDVAKYNRWSQLDVALGRTPRIPVVTKPDKLDKLVEFISSLFVFSWRLVLAIITLLCIPLFLIGIMIGVPGIIIFACTAPPATLLGVILLILIFG